jgi:Flp pilus assembly protein TadG
MNVTCVRRCQKGERGSSIVEFAIAATALLMLMFAIIDFGRALYTYHLVASGARAGSRYAIVRGTSCMVSGCPATATQIQDYVRGLAPAIDPNALTVNTTWPTSSGCNGSATPGCPVSVQVSYTFAFIAPLMPQFTLPMTSTSTMVISQ